MSFMRKVLRAGWLPSPFTNFQSRICLGGLLFSLLSAGSVRANVYATNIRLNGGVGNVLLSTATNVNINYILNEPATMGVTIEIKSGATTIRTIAITNPSPGTLLGTNLVVWDGMDDNGTNVGPGTYAISITASATGYGGWTPISDDNNLYNYVWEGRGIAVNKNANSPYYGRVFVANSFMGQGVSAGDKVGLIKLNSDGTPGEEGVFSDGGWSWAGDEYSPWKIEVAEDDRVYVGDPSGGVILSFDQTLSTNSLRVVLTTNNYSSAVGHLSGPFITGGGTNTQVWVADANDSGSLGIRRWQIGASGSVATNDLGTVIVAAGGGTTPSFLSAPSYTNGQFQFTLKGQGGVSYVIQASADLKTWTDVATSMSANSNRSIAIPAPDSRSFYRASSSGSDLNFSPYDLAIDRSNRIYTIQSRLTGGDAAFRVFRFPAYAGTAESTADWKIGSGDDTMEGAYGIAVDPFDRYVAVAFVGDSLGSGSLNGAVRVFEATNGSPVVTLPTASDHSHTDVAWDGVGNLYTLYASFPRQGLTRQRR